MGSQINRIHLLQKRAILNISNSNFRAHTEPLFKERNLLKVQDIYYIAVLKFYFKLVKYFIILTTLLHRFLRDINITISEIQPDCQKLNTNFQDNPGVID